MGEMFFIQDTDDIKKYGCKTKSVDEFFNKISL